MDIDSPKGSVGNLRTEWTCMHWPCEYPLKPCMRKDAVAMTVGTRAQAVVLAR